MTTQFEQVITEYGLLRMWFEVTILADGTPVVVGVDVVEYVPSAEMRHNVIADYRAAGRKRRWTTEVKREVLEW